MAVLAGLTFICMPVVLDRAQKLTAPGGDGSVCSGGLAAARIFVETGEMEVDDRDCDFVRGGSDGFDGGNGDVLIPFQLLRRVGSSIETGPSPQPSHGVPGEGGRKGTSS